MSDTFTWVKFEKKVSQGHIVKYSLHDAFIQHCTRKEDFCSRFRPTLDKHFN